MVDVAPEPSCIEWAWAGAAFEGALESGDLHLVLPLARGALLAVIDGLGHGSEAADAAHAAAVLVRDGAALPIPELLERCHEGLRKTRGVVMSVVKLDAPSSSIEWFGVGNVEGLLLRARPLADRGHETISARGGVLGYRLPKAKVRCSSIARGDVLVLVTDGIRSDFAREIPLDWPPQAIADWLLSRYGSARDDALALVARYLGASL